jgi:hypothetical protein
MQPARRPLPAALAALAFAAAVAAPAISAPTGPWAELGGQDRGSYRWSVKARPSAEGKGPCLMVAASWRSGPLEYHRSTYRECAATPALRRFWPPLIAVGAQPSTAAPAKISAVGMLFAPAARRLRVTFAGGRTDTIGLRKLDSANAGTAWLRAFRYAAFAIRGEWCAERLVSLSAGGRVLWDSGVDGYRCGSSGEPQFAARAKCAGAENGAARPAQATLWPCQAARGARPSRLAQHRDPPCRCIA